MTAKIRNKGPEATWRDADWSEQLLADDRTLHRAIATLPDPAEAALELTRDERRALTAAMMGKDGCYAHHADAAILRPLGLCDCSSDRQRGRMLTAWGMALRRAVIAQTTGKGQ